MNELKKITAGTAIVEFDARTPPSHALPRGLSVIVPTYNNSPALERVLEGFANQHCCGPFEVLVVNDGGERLAPDSIVKDYAERLDVRLLYVEPESEIYRVNHARNLGLENAKFQRVLINDGDSIPCAKTVEVHSSYEDSPGVVQSQRVLIPRDVMPAVSDCPTGLDKYGRRLRFDEAQHRFANGMAFPSIGPSMSNTGVFPLCWYEAWTYSCSFPTAPARAIGGFWEMMLGHFANDSEFMARLDRLGFWFAANLWARSYHLGHERPWDNPEARQKQADALRESRANPAVHRQRCPLK